MNLVHFDGGALAIDVVVIVVSFLVGAIPFGVLVSRAFYGTDIRSSGSGNIGAANALRTLGKRGAVAVLVLDALKGFVPASYRRFLENTLRAEFDFEGVPLTFEFRSRRDQGEHGERYEESRE